MKTVIKSLDDAIRQLELHKKVLANIDGKNLTKEQIEQLRLETDRLTMQVKLCIANDINTMKKKTEIL